MKRPSHMQNKYFLRKLGIYLACITSPIVLMGSVLILYSRHQLQKEFSSYARQSREHIYYNVNSSLNVFSEMTSLFSSTPSLAIAISKLLNEETLDYHNSVYRSLVSQLIGTSANLNRYVDSIYIYFDNPNGKFISSNNEYTHIHAPNVFDSDWLSIYENTPSEVSSWIVKRQVTYYSFETARDTISIFRRLNSQNGIMVLNLNMDQLSQMLSSNQIYSGTFTLVTDSDGNVLFDSSGSADNISFAALSAEDLTTSSSYDTITVDGLNYLYFTSALKDYDLVIVSLIPAASVFKTVNSMIITIILLLIASVIISIGLSLTITRSDFRQLNTLMDVFVKAEQGEPIPTQLNRLRSEYDVIFNNLVHTFISNNSLKLILAQAQVQQKDAQLAALQLQLNPHFIFNTLQTIDIEILRNLPEKNMPSSLIYQLAEILKYSLENTGKMVLLKDEISICKTYAEIQKLRYENPFILYYDYDEEVLNTSCIHLILQPLLENSLHHGIKNVERKGLVKIRIFKREEYVNVHIIDNGMGISRERLAGIRRQLQERNLNHTSHIGIYNTNLRLILTYGSEAGIHICSKEGMGTLVKFRFRGDYPIV